tara:strand:- start:146 stop:673 length:528 start_codon:yes stop_codon:yes gene_type:complete
MTDPDDVEIILTRDELLSTDDVAKIFIRKIEAKRRIEYVSNAYGGELMTDAIRQRFTREIAEDLLKDNPSTAHFYALERLSMGRIGEEKMWRDVLAWLDELTEEGAGDVRGVTGDTNLDGRDSEHKELPEVHSTNDVEATRPVSLHDGADGDRQRQDRWTQPCALAQYLDVHGRN